MKKLTFTLICLLPAFTCQARTITVDDNGPTDFNTIQAAIDDSNDGDIIEVQPALRYNYAPNELIVKFKKSAADMLTDGISNGRQIRNLRLSNSLDNLNKKYRFKKAKPLFKNFRENTIF